MISIQLIGERIKELREFKGLSQAELANYLKDKGLTISRETISKMENGSRNISIIELKAISEVFDVTTDFFLEEEEEETLVSLFRKKTQLDEADEIFLDDINVTVQLLIAQEKLYREDIINRSNHKGDVLF